MSSLFQDLKYAIRQLSRTPTLTLAAVFALALGIGANVAIFSAVNAVLLNSMPFRSISQPQQLVSLYSSNPAILQILAGRLPVNFKNFSAWNEQSRSFSAMEAYQDVQLNLTSGNSAEPEIVQAVSVTPGFLPMLSIAPRVGRNFTRAESDGGDHVAIISDDLWRSRFSANPGVIGQTFRASNTDYQIIGVLPPGLELGATGQGLDQSKPKLWLPMHLHPSQDEENGMALTVIARLKTGVTVAQARAEMHVIGDRLARQVPDDKGWSVNVFPTIQEDVDPDVRSSLLVMQFAVGFVLLIACANVANLLLTKAVAREKEMAVRVAIGASAWRIIRQNLTESLVLSVTAGALGFLFSLGLMGLVSLLAPKDVHGFHELRLDRLVIAFTFGLSLLSGLLFGLTPSIHSLRQGPAESLSRGSRSVAGSSRRFRGALIILEIAMSLVLLVGAGLTIRSLLALMSTDKGFNIDHLLTMGITLPSYRYANPQEVAAFDDLLLARVRELPGMRAASLATALPMRRISEQSFNLPGVAVDPNHLKVTDWARVTAEHVQALGLHLLKGRNLTPADVNAAEPSVALVNQAFAEAIWPGQNPLGKMFLFNDENNKETHYSVVGVVSNAHQFGPDSGSHIEIYVPGHHMQGMLLLVRTDGDPLALANAVKHQIWSIDKDQPVSEVDSMENILYDWVAPRRFVMTIMIAFGVIALISAAVGLYSVLAYAVTLRTREIGVRVALGADPARVAGMVMREGLVLSLVGVILGLAGAFSLTRFMQSLIFGISAFDVTTFLGVSGLLILVALLASYMPARRASLVNPTEALRSE